MEEAGNKRRKRQRKVWRREEDAAVHQSGEEPPTVKWQLSSARAPQDGSLFSFSSS